MRAARVIAAVAAVTLTLLGAPASAGQVSAAAPGWAPTLPLSAYQGRMWLSANADGSAFAFRDNADAYGGMLFRSGDFGVTWEALGLAPFGVPFGGRGAASAAFASATLGYGVDAAVGMWRTTDGGETWQALEGPALPGTEPWVGLVTAVPGTDVVVTGVGPFTREVAVALSQDRGETWTALPLGFEGSVWDLRFLDGEHGLVLARTAAADVIADVVYAVAPDLEGELQATKVMDCPAPGCTAVGLADHDTWFVGLQDGTLLRTEDAGATFTETRLAGTLPVLPGLEAAYWVEGLAFADAEVGYAATAGHGTFRTTDGGVTWIREPSTTEVLGLAIGGLAVADREHAIAGGRNAVVTRFPD